MTDADLWAAWRLWMGVAAIVVLIAAALLITIWVTARTIVRDAVRALKAVNAIRANTQPIWELAETNEIAEDIVKTVRAIDEKSTMLAGSLAGKKAPR